MGFSIETYAISKKYTDETAAEFGALKGANCTIDSIEKRNSRNIVTFKWTNSEGEIRTSTMIVQDGTPIYEWKSGDLYNYGDLVIYASAFYRCTTPNSDITFDNAKWAEIGSPDGNYDIVETADMLPPIFTAADRKMYYCIAEDIFYFWNGSTWEQRQQPKLQFMTLPPASATFVGKIFQYTGATTGNFTRGYWYICEETGQGTGIYQWAGINVQDHVAVDNVLSGVSENPVQNKVITHVISRLNSDISDEASARQRIDRQLELAISALITDVDAAQPKTLSTPIVIDGSTVTTVEGALGALNNKTVDVDSALSDVSTNPVQNKVVKGGIDTKQDDVGFSIVNGQLCITYEEEV